MENIYFALTEAFNRAAPTVALASGQAVVEIALTTDPDRVLALAAAGASSRRPAVVAALSGAGRLAVVTAPAEEADELQQRDAARLDAYDEAARRYVAECRAVGLADLPLREAHARLCEIAERRLPTQVR